MVFNSPEAQVPLCVKENPEISQDTYNTRINKKSSPNYIQYFAAFSASLTFLITGTNWAWSSPAFAIFNSDSPPFEATNDQISFAISLGTVSAIPGPIIGAILVDRIGRKIVILLSAVPFFISWLVIFFSTNIFQIYIAKLLSGIATGTAISVVPMYIGEIASADIRGTLANMMMLQIKIGILIAYLVGSHVSFYINAAIMGIIPILLFISFLPMPETPYFYLLRNDKVSALKSLERLKGSNNLQDEIYQITEKIKLSQNISKWGLLKQRGNRKALLLTLGIYLTQQLCGIQTLTAYTSTILSQIDTPNVANNVGISFAFLSVFSLTLTGFFIDKVNRRTLFLLSALLTAIAYTVIGMYFYLKFMNFNVVSFVVVPNIAFLCFPITYGLGLGPLPYIYSSELFSPSFKAFASSLLSSYMGATAFGMLTVYPVAVKCFGLHVVLLAFGISSLIGTIICVICLPETKGRTLEQIQDDLNISEISRDQESP